jgi:Histidine kinase
MGLRDRKTLVMALAIAGGYLLIATTNFVDWASREPATKTLTIAAWEVLYNGSACATNIVVCLLYSALRERLQPAWLGVSAAVLCFTGGMFWVTLAWQVIRLAGLPEWAQVHMGPITIFFQGGLASGTTLFLVSFLYFGIEYWRQAADEKEKTRRAVALAHQARLQMLRYQLNPHFLFNALNSIRGMILEDPRRSREMVTELADFLRYSLDGRGDDGTVADELKAIENYLTIQRIRFEQQLDVVSHVDVSARNVSVPSFLIHPLVENAVKYGMKTSAMPLRIRIRVTRQDQDLTVLVSNTGHLANGTFNDSLDGAGVGLRNITERLKLAFPERHSFSIDEHDGWVHAEIRLKLLPAGCPG